MCGIVNKYAWTLLSTRREVPNPILCPIFWCGTFYVYFGTIKSNQSILVYKGLTINILLLTLCWTLINVLFGHWKIILLYKEKNPKVLLEPKHNIRYIFVLNVYTWVYITAPVKKSIRRFHCLHQWWTSRKCKERKELKW